MRLRTPRAMSFCACGDFRVATPPLRRTRDKGNGKTTILRIVIASDTGYSPLSSLRITSWIENTAIPRHRQAMPFSLWRQLLALSGSWPGDRSIDCIFALESREDFIKG